MPAGKKIGAVLITGGRGNLGRKLTAHLLGAGLCERVICLDHAGAERGPTDPRLVQVDIDLADAGSPVLATAMDGVDAVVHFAASNPAPDAPWDQSRESFEMTLRVASQAAASGVKRLVFSSSNHAMGRYKDPPLSQSIRPGELGAQSFPAPGTLWHENGQLVDGVAYGSTKLLGIGLQRRCAKFQRPHDQRLSPHRLVPAGREPAGDNYRQRHPERRSCRNKYDRGPAFASLVPEHVAVRPRLRAGDGEGPAGRLQRLADTRDHRQRNVRQSRNGLGRRNGQTPDRLRPARRRLDSPRPRSAASRVVSPRAHAVVPSHLPTVRRRVARLERPGIRYPTPAPAPSIRQCGFQDWDALRKGCPSARPTAG